MTPRGALPPGYVRLDLPHARVVVRAAHADDLRAALAGRRTLHGWAGEQPGARALQGRGTAWAAPLPASGARVVVRHNRHGGLLAPLTGDRFLAPTRAPRELRAALRLAAAGIDTPEVVAFVTYPAGLLGALARSDVATREVADARDLGDVLMTLVPGSGARRAAIDAAARLADALARAGARHHDLNVKNILLAGDPARPRALLLDVDRVTFHRPGDRRVRAANLARLLRSVRKYERVHGARVEGAELAAFEAASRGGGRRRAG